MAGESLATGSQTFDSLISSVTQAQSEGLRLQQALNDASQKFEAESSGLEMEQSVFSKIARIVSDQANSIR